MVFGLWRLAGHGGLLVFLTTVHVWFNAADAKRMTSIANLVDDPRQGMAMMAAHSILIAYLRGADVCWLPGRSRRRAPDMRCLPEGACRCNH